jgi:hypothetical protein
MRASILRYRSKSQTQGFMHSQETMSAYLSCNERAWMVS